MKKIIYLIIILLVGVFGFTFIYQNPQVVSVKYYGGLAGELKLGVLLLAATGVGIVIGALLALMSTLKVQRRLSRTRRDLKRSEQRVADLEKTPAIDAS